MAPRSPAPNANGHRRRQVIARVRAEETHCALCGTPVDQTLTWSWGQHGPKCDNPGCPGCVPHPMRPEVDEIIPRSQGGSPTERSNCRLTHRQCNLERSVQTQRRASPRPVGPFVVTRAW